MVTGKFLKVIQKFWGGQGYILPYKSIQNNDMGCKSRPKLGRSQLTPEYEKGQYLLTLMRIPNSGIQFPRKFKDNAFFWRKIYFHKLFFEFKHQTGNSFVFAILHLTFAFLCASEKTAFICCHLLEPFRAVNSPELLPGGFVINRA